MDPNYITNTNLIKYGINLDLNKNCYYSAGMPHTHTHNLIGNNNVNNTPNQLISANCMNTS